MAKETLVPRFYGSETEYTYTLPEGINHRDYDPGYLMPNVVSAGEFLQNGGRMYPDCDLLEYSTPECPNLDELVAHELAGERLVHEAYSNGRSEVLSIHKRTKAPMGGFTMGAHENYSVTQNWSDDLLFRDHLATRTVFTGAGSLQPDGYTIGQKVAWIDTVTRRDTGSEFQRLEVRSGDANLSPWAIRMKFGTTSLVLRLLEHGIADDDRLYDCDRVALNVAGKKKSMYAPFLLDSGKTASALDVQEKLAEKSQWLSERVELPAQEQAIIPEWFAILDALRRDRKTSDPQEELKQIDWYTKHEIIKKAAARRGEAVFAVGLAYELNYDKVPDGLGVRLRKSRFVDHSPSEERIEQARITPPDEGRAKLRGDIVKVIYEKKLPLRTHWDTVFDENLDEEDQLVAGSLGPVNQSYTNEESKQKAESIVAKFSFD